MGNEVNLHLSGGVFFNLVLAARKPKSARQETCLRDLLGIYNRSARNLSGNSFKTIASKFRNCDPDMRSEYIMFGDAVTVDAFETRIRNDYDAVVQEVKDFSDKYLDLETNGRWLVRAILELIEADDRIGEEERFFIGLGNVPVCKRSIRSISEVNFYCFLLGVWHYICTHEPSGSGQETFFHLSDFEAEGKPRKLVRERIGFKNFEGVRIDYGTVTFSPDEVLPGSGDFSDGNEHVPHGVGGRNRYSNYLKNVKDKHGFKKSFFYEHRKPFYDFFVCNDIIRHGDRTAVPIKNISIDDFPAEHRCIILSGTGGQGKTMMMTHLLLDTIEHREVYK